jgi:hypothetical protein
MPFLKEGEIRCRKNCSEHLKELDSNVGETEVDQADADQTDANPFTIVQKIMQIDALIDLFENWHTIGLRSLHLYVMGTKKIMLQDRGLLCFALNVYKKGHL